MNSGHKGFALPIAIALVAVLLGGGAYMYISSGGRATAEDEIAAEAQKLRERAKAERDKLSEIQSRFLSTRPLNSAIASSFDRLSAALFDKADLLFDVEVSSDPELKFKTTGDIASGILAGRRKMEEILIKWFENRNSALQEEAYRDTILNMIADAEEVEEYLENLEETVNNLTPDDSGLSESEINTYIAAVEAAKQDIEEVIEILEEALEAESASSSAETGGSAFTNTGSQGNANESTSGQTSQGASQTTQTVTPAEVQAQQALVDQIQAQIDALEEQLANLQSQNNPQNQNTVTDYSSNINYASSQENYAPVWHFPAEDLPSKPIIKSTGAPSLIEWENSD